MDQKDKAVSTTKQLYRYLDESRGVPETEEVEGFTLSKAGIQLFLPGLTLKAHFQNVKQMELRSDDIILCAYSKCGTNWLWEILNMLVLGTTTYRKEHKETHMIDFRAVEILDKIPSPRILNTHLPVHLLPRAIKEKGCKVVYIYRNPKDATVSAYNHFEKTFKTLGITAGSLTEYKKYFLSDRAIPYNFFKYIKEFELFFNNHPDIPVHVLSYEDLKFQPLVEVKRLAQFVEKQHGEDFLQAVIDACSFDNMKLADAAYKEDFLGKRTASGESVIYRKGKVGDWKNHFTVAESEMYDAVTKRELEGLNIQFRYQ